MYCTKCNKHIAICGCNDLEERLESIAETGKVVMAWCKKCNRHIDRCICKPEDAVDN